MKGSAEIIQLLITYFHILLTSLSLRSSIFLRPSLKTKNCTAFGNRFPDLKPQLCLLSICHTKPPHNTYWTTLRSHLHSLHYITIKFRIHNSFTCHPGVLTTTKTKTYKHSSSHSPTCVKTLSAASHQRRHIRAVPPDAYRSPPQWLLAQTKELPAGGQNMRLRIALLPRDRLFQLAGERYAVPWATLLYSEM